LVAGVCTALDLVARAVPSRCWPSCSAALKTEVERELRSTVRVDEFLVPIGERRTDLAAVTALEIYRTSIIAS